MYTNNYNYIILLFYTHYHSPPQLFFRNQQPSLPHYIMRRTIGCLPTHSKELPTIYPIVLPLLCISYLLTLLLLFFSLLHVCVFSLLYGAVALYYSLNTSCHLVSFVVGRWLTHPFGSLPTGEVGAFGCEATDDTFSIGVLVTKVSNRGFDPCE